MSPPATWGAARRLAARLPPLRLRRLARAVLGRDTPARLADDDPVTPGEALVLLAAALLASRRWVGEAEQDLVLEEYGRAVRDFGDKLAAALAAGGKLPVAQLVFLDARYARLSGREGCLDLRTGEAAARPAAAPIEAVAVDLTALYLRSCRAAAAAQPAQPAAAGS